MVYQEELSIRQICRACQQIGDCPNIEMPVGEDGLFWRTVKRTDGWTLQENRLTGLARILDGGRVRKAWGSPDIMCEKFRRLTRPEFLEPGDVIGVSRGGVLHFYEHYAVYIGNDEVIHYADEGGDISGRITVHRAPMDEFLKGENDCFVLYFTEGQSSPRKIWRMAKAVDVEAMLADSIQLPAKRSWHLYSPQEAVQRAMSRLGEESYNLALNNCEHFAIWCRTGVHESYQVRHAVAKIALIVADSSDL